MTGNRGIPRLPLNSSMISSSIARWRYGAHAAVSVPLLMELGVHEFGFRVPLPIVRDEQPLDDTEDRLAGLFGDAQPEDRRGIDLVEERRVGMERVVPGEGILLMEARLLRVQGNPANPP